MIIFYSCSPPLFLDRVWGADRRECHSTAAEQEIYFLSGISFKEMIFSYYVKYLRKEAPKVAVSEHLALHQIFAVKCQFQYKMFNWMVLLLDLVIVGTAPEDCRHTTLNMMIIR